MPTNILNSKPVAYCKRPEKGIKSNHNYKGINEALLKNQHPLLLMTKIFNIVYGPRLFIKLKFIAPFNKIKLYQTISKEQRLLLSLAYINTLLYLLAY